MEEDAQVAPFDLEWLKWSLEDRGIKVGKNPAIVAICLLDHLMAERDGNPLGEPDQFLTSDEEVLESKPKPKQRPSSKRQYRLGEDAPYGDGWNRTKLRLIEGGKEAQIWSNR